MSTFSANTGNRSMLQSPSETVAGDLIVVAVNTQLVQDPADDARPVKRAKYAARACSQCRQRKVKCSGQQACDQCVANGLNCEYPTSQRQKRSISVKASGDNAPDREILINAVQEMMTRIASLEHSCTLLKSQTHHATDQLAYAENSSIATNRSSLSPPGLGGFPGTTSLSRQFEALQQSVSTIQAGLNAVALVQPSRPHSPEPLGDHVPHMNGKPPRNPSEVIQRQDRARFEKSVDLYFSYWNQFTLCIDETEFRDRWALLFTTEPPPDFSDSDCQQFIALIHLVHALVCITSEDCLSSNVAPGWAHFCRGESILSRLTWLGQGNIMTVQYYMIAAQYLLLAERAVAAYNAIHKAVCLCWQLGLHNQTSWTHCSVQETLKRQQVFWALFHIERHISFNIGAPYLIRRNDFKVDIPTGKNQEGLLLPDPTTSSSTPQGMDPSVDAFIETIDRWSSFCEDMWDNLFCVSAQRPWNPEYLVVADARLCHAASQTPTSLQWEHICHLLGDPDPASFVHVMKAAVPLLRTNQMRLLLRQERILHELPDEIAAGDCIAIASKSAAVIQAIHDTKGSHATDRYGLLTFLAACITPLTCIILKKGNSYAHRQAAATTYQQVLNMIRDMAPGFSAARHVLQRLDKIVTTTEKAIRNIDSVTSVSPFGDFEAGNLILGLTNSFRPDSGLDFNDDSFRGTFDENFCSATDLDFAISALDWA